MFVRLLRFAVVITCFSGGTRMALPQNQEQAPADNSKMNKRDRSQDRVTADQQKNEPG